MYDHEAGWPGAQPKKEVTLRGQRLKREIGLPHDCKLFITLLCDSESSPENKVNISQNYFKNRVRTNEQASTKVVHHTVLQLLPDLFLPQDCLLQDNVSVLLSLCLQ